MVYFSNSTEAAAYFAARGVTVPVYDLRNRASLPAGPSGDLVHGGFAQRAASYPDADDHFLAPPFCYRLAAGFFESLSANCKSTGVGRGSCTPVNASSGFLST